MLPPVKIIAWVHHGLGDVIMALPALIAMDRSVGKGARVAFVVKSNVERRLIQLICWESQIDIISLDNSGKWDLLKTINRALRLRRTKPDYLIAPHASDSIAASWFAFLIGAKLSIGPESKWSSLGFKKTIPYTLDTHKVCYYSRFFEVIGMYSEKSESIPFLLSNSNHSKANDMLFVNNKKPVWIFVSPGSGSAEQFKRWPVAKYKCLLTRLINHNENIYIGMLGSPTEKQLLKDIATVVENRERCRIFSQPDLELTFALLENAQCFISGCTGGAHMAAMLNLPIVGIYGPTNYSVTGPFSNKLRVVSQYYKCSPCYRDGFDRGCGNPVCMEEIPVEKVFGEVLEHLHGNDCPELRTLVTTSATAYEK